ncbi:MAG: flagellar hook protein FlgE [Nitrospiraceae bacterium]|nr:flagellar hook protein FlgE [Nitrospiraceae bacterium]
MLSSMNAAVSGMNANGTMLSVISDNIANQNTVGFKSSSVNFEDVLSGMTGSVQVGRGVLVSSTAPSFAQGSFESTTNALDMAIDGNGFFIVQPGSGTAYTRAGQFSTDKGGNIVNPDGAILQGYQADSSGNITGAMGNLKIATSQVPANITTKANVAVNLQSTAAAEANPFTLDSNGDGIANDPGNYNFSTTISIFDSQGASHPVTAYFAKTADNAWTVHYVYEDPANPGSLLEAGTQNLTFNTNGSLNNDNSGTAIPFNFGPSVAAQSVTFDYGTGTGETPAGDGFDGTTQFASDFATMDLNQNGYASGTLKDVTVGNSGIISGVFTNGQTRSIGQVALAKFIAPTELSKMGKNLYGETYGSGQPIVGAPNTSGLGSVLSNTLEQSNVDLADEFVKMIAAQRGFEADSKIITTTDQLMQQLVNLKQ